MSGQRQTGKQPRAKISRNLSLFLPAALLLIGCATPGPPRPPTLRLPRTVTDLQASRIGPQVHLQWTNPTETTDGETLPGAPIKQGPAAIGTRRRAARGNPALTAEICREQPPKSPQTSPRQPAAKTAGEFPSGCITVGHLPVQPGEKAQWNEDLPATLQTNPATLLAYRVRILNNNHRSAPPSAPATALSGESPSKINNLRAIATRQGAAILWDAPPNIAPAETILLLRHRIVADGSTAPKSKTAAEKTSSQPEDVELRVLSATATHGSGAGTVDPSAVMGSAYSYSVQRLQTVTVNGATFEERSEPATVLTGVLRDQFAPDTPTGLAAIPVGDANAPAVDLSWEPNAGTETVLYIVYRAEQGAAAIRVNAQPVSQTALHDTGVASGKHYQYTVTAIDTAGNESKPSQPTDAFVRP